MTVLAVTLEYGEPFPAGVGAYEHPIGDGTTAALQVGDVVSFESDDDAIAWGIELEENPMVHRVEFIEQGD